MPTRPLDSGVQHGRTAIGAVAVVDGAAPDCRLLTNLLAERIRPTFDVDVHRVALPVPGDERELFRVIADAIEHPRGYHPPPWECWLIEGLENDRWAILIEVHHKSADDLSPMRLLGLLCDDADPADFPNDFVRQPDSPPALMTLRNVATRVVASDRNTRRRYRTVQVPRATVNKVCRKFGVTAQEAALAAITEGFRTDLVGRGEQPHPESSPTLHAALPYLPVEQNNAIQQLRAVHDRLRRPSPVQRRRAGISAYTPLALCAKAISAIIGQPRGDVVALDTNARGPRRRWRLMGHRVARVLPVPPTAFDVDTGVAVLAYGDELVFAITVSYDAAAQIGRLASGIEHGIERLVALSDDSVLLFDRRRKRPLRAVTNDAARWRPSSRPARIRH